MNNKEWEQVFEPIGLARDAFGAKVFKTSQNVNLVYLATYLLVFIPGLQKAFADRPASPFVVMETWALFALRCAAVPLIFCCLWRLFRPATLIANASGFELTGSFEFSPKLQRWNDVERFFVTSTPAGKRVACALRPSAQREFRARGGAIASNAKAIFADFYPTNPDAVVAELNRYWQRVAGGASLAADISSASLDQVHETGVRPMAPKTIRSSRSPVYHIIACAAVLVVRGARLKSWSSASVALLGSMFGVILVLVGWRLLRPVTLTMDGRGFTLSGGFFMAPKTVPWTDVRQFAAYNIPRTGKVIGCVLQPDADSASQFSSLESRLGEGAVSLGPLQVSNTDEVVQDLNAYRQRALGLRTDPAGPVEEAA